MNVRHTLWKLTSLLMGGGLMFFFNLSLMRSLGPSTFGLWAFALSWAGLFSVLVDFGFNPLISRDLARTPEKGPAFFRTILKSKAWLAVLALALLIGTSLVHPEARLHIPLMIGALLFLAGNSLIETGQAFTHAYERFFDGTLMATGYKLIVALTGLTLLFLARPIGIIMAGVCVASLIGVLFNVWMLRTRIFPRSHAESSHPWKPLLAIALPLFIQNAFILVYFKIDTVMLTSMRGLNETGVYSAAYRFFELSNLLPTALVAAHVAELSRRLRSKDGFAYLGRVGILFVAAALAGMLALGVAGFLFQSAWIGTGYERSQQVLWILAGGLLFYFPNFLFTTVLVLLDRTRANVWIAGIAVLFNIAMNWVAIPRWGATGSAWATVATEALICGGCLGVILWSRRDPDHVR